MTATVPGISHFFLRTTPLTEGLAYQTVHALAGWPAGRAGPGLEIDSVKQLGLKNQRAGLAASRIDTRLHCFRAQNFQILRSTDAL